MSDGVAFLISGVGIIAPTATFTRDLWELASESSLAATDKYIFPLVIIALRGMHE